MDVARPIDFDDKILETRPDIELIRCGLIKFPGAECKIDFHFNGYYPACLIQVIILALTGENQRSTKTIRISAEDVDWFIDKLNFYGFEVDTSHVDEYGVFSDGQN
jgi:predicted amino acid dehydrogenase